MPHSTNQTYPAQTWQIKAIEKSLKKANSKKAKFVEHQDISDWLNTWSKDNNKDK